jgi:hypothetical protein
MSSDERVIKAAKELSVAGFTVKYLEHVNIVRVDIEGKSWYVNNPPEVEKYGKEFKSSRRGYCGSTEPTFIELTYENDIKCTLDIIHNRITINNIKYIILGYAKNYAGHLFGNSYVNYIGIWVKKGSYPYNINKIGNNVYDYTPQIDIGDNLLDLDFMPVKPQTVEIKNEGFKLIKIDIITDHDSNFTFAVFDYAELIVDGIYNGNGDYKNNLFGFVNQDNELFSLLLDPQTKEFTLTSATKNIPVHRLENYLIKPEDGLYNGYKIESDGVISSDYDDEEDDGDYVDNDFRRVFMYNYTFFRLDGEQSYIIELKAKKPNSGINTKAAIRDSY